MTGVQPGRWNPVTVILPGIDAKEFRTLEVRIKPSVLSLKR